LLGLIHTSSFGWASVIQWGLGLQKELRWRCYYRSRSRKIISDLRLATGIDHGFTSVLATNNAAEDPGECRRKRMYDYFRLDSHPEQAGEYAPDFISSTCGRQSGLSTDLVQVNGDGAELKCKLPDQDPNKKGGR